MFAADAGARAPSIPPTPLVVRAEGEITTGAVRGTTRNRYSLTPPAKGTLIVSLQPIQGASPRALLRKADGKIIRRDKNGQLWTRSPPDEALVLEVYARSPDAPGSYQLRVVFDVDRPREERELPRPARPGDVVPVSKRGQQIERVLVDGIQAEFKDHGANALVTIPAFARAGRIELHREAGAPDIVNLALTGTEPPSPDIVTDVCGPSGLNPPPGCIQLAVSPAVGRAWLQEIARIVDADIASHSQMTGAVLLKLRLASSESFAIATLSAMPGVRAAHR